MGRISQAKAKRRKILEHYYSLLVSIGYEHCSIVKIAAEMKVHPSNIMYYFKTKEEMTLELFDFCLDTYIQSQPILDGSAKDESEELTLLLHFEPLSKEDSKHLQTLLYLLKYLSFHSTTIHDVLSKKMGMHRSRFVELFKSFYEAKIIKNGDAETLADLYLSLRSAFEELRWYTKCEESLLVSREMMAETMKIYLQINYANYTPEVLCTN